MAVPVAPINKKKSDVDLDLDRFENVLTFSFITCITGGMEERFMLLCYLYGK